MGGWPVGYLHNPVEKLNSGLPRTNPDSSRVEDLNQGPSDFKSSTLNHSATQPPSHLEVLERFNNGQLKKTWPQWAFNLSLQYGHVILVRRYLTLTGVNWSKHGCPISKKETEGGCRHCAYTPTSNPTSHDNSWVSSSFIYCMVLHYSKDISDITYCYNMPTRGLLAGETKNSFVSRFEHF